jgi:predicted RNA-binding protein
MYQPKNENGYQRDKIMTNYWLCITNEENWNIMRKQKVWGIPERYKGLIGKVRKGDFLVFYVSPKKIAGVFQAASEPFEDRKKIFSHEGFEKREIFPHRIRVEPVLLPEKSVEFDHLIQKLKFIISKTKWMGYLRRAMVPIPKEDYDLILSTIAKEESSIEMT